MDDGASTYRTLWLAVISAALEDLREAVECTCAEVDGWRCKRCELFVDPWEEHGRCRKSDQGNGHRHYFHCRHLFRSARRLLLGTDARWQSWRDEVCGLADVPVMKVKARALAVLKARRPDAA